MGIRTSIPPAGSCCGAARPDEARAAYTRALELTSAEPEILFLRKRLAELG